MVGGCSDNVYSGKQSFLTWSMMNVKIISIVIIKFIKMINWQVSRQFLDTRELGNSPKSLANLHNNQVLIMIGMMMISSRTQ